MVALEKGEEEEEEDKEEEELEGSKRGHDKVKCEAKKGWKKKKSESHE